MTDPTHEPTRRRYILIPVPGRRMGEQIRTLVRLRLSFNSGTVGVGTVHPCTTR
jgi:hypothetical protein